MTRKARKRKLEDEEPCIPNWDDENIFPDTVIREMKTMWEIPQIFHFLHLTKEALNVSHLSMFEMERMLLMPRASKQLANIMTSLLSSPIFKGKLKKVPPMPYEFWTNVLAHKVKGWFKTYESKHRNSVKVLESIGVEPEFWTIFPDDSIFDGKDFEELSFKRRVWLLKTVCDTLMHTRKKIQEETARQPLENRFETVLGTDRHGARYIYFPQFVKSDLRVYRHSLDNKILSSAKLNTNVSLGDPESVSASGSSTSRRKSARDKTVRSVRSKKNNITKCEQEGHTSDCKCNLDSGHGSPANDDTNLSSTSTCGNANRIDLNTINVKRSRSLSKLSETSIESNKAIRRITRSSGYDSNTSAESSTERRRSQRMFKGFADNNSGKRNMELLGGMLTGLKSKIAENNTAEDSERRESWKTDDEKLDEIIGVESNRVSKDETSKSDDEKLGENLQPSLDENGIKLPPENACRLEDEKAESDSSSWSDSPEHSDSDSNDENDIESLNELRAQLQKEAFRSHSSINKRNTTEYNLRKQKQDTETNESESRIYEFKEMLADLGVSTFQLVADGVESLKTLACSFTEQEDTQAKDAENNSDSLPLCEVTLVERLKELLSSVEEHEPSLRDSMKKARTKLQKEWTSLNDGSVEDQDSSGEGGLGSNWWIVGSQGDSVPSSSESKIQTVQEPTVSSLSSDNAAGNEQTCGKDTDDTTENENQQENSTKTSMEERSDTERKGANQDEQRRKENSGESQETQRVLRARGVSSYREEFSSDDEFEAYELEERSNTETVDTTSSPQTSTSTTHSTAKVRHNCNLSNQEDSDKDWILPSPRKRKNRRPSASRRLKSFQHKIETIQTDMDNESANPRSTEGSISAQASKSKPAVTEIRTVHLPKQDEHQSPSSTIIATPDNTNTSDDPQKVFKEVEPKVEPVTSIHSEIHIKEESPVCDSTSNINETNYGVAIPQSYVMVNANHPPMSYYVMQPAPVTSNVLPQGTIMQAPSLVPAIVPQVEQGYYVQDSQGYIIPHTQAAYVSSQQTGYHVQNPMMGTQQVVAHASYMPYVVATAPSQIETCSNSPALQSVPIPQALPNSPIAALPPRARGPQSTHIRPTTSINFPHPTGAVIRSSSMPIRGNAPRRGGSKVVKTKGRQLHPQHQRVGGQATPSGSTGQKTTSLICLSDSDDEIEMIITEKTVPETQSETTRTPPKKPVQEGIQSENSSQAVLTIGNSGLPAEIVQRMSQGGISIIPLKPQTQTTSNNPPLVVVVNETGSHYALALPDGNKLILTPEQVAQIRAYNGGKLIT